MTEILHVTLQTGRAASALLAVATSLTAIGAGDIGSTSMGWTTIDIDQALPLITRNYGASLVATWNTGPIAIKSISAIRKFVQHRALFLGRARRLERERIKVDGAGDSASLLRERHLSSKRSSGSTPRLGRGFEPFTSSMSPVTSETLSPRWGLDQTQI